LEVGKNWVEPKFEPFTITESSIYEITIQTKKNGEYVFPYAKLNGNRKAESTWQYVYDKAATLRATYFKEKSTADVKQAVNAQVTFLMSEEALTEFKQWFQSFMVPLLAQAQTQPKK